VPAPPPSPLPSQLDDLLRRRLPRVAVTQWLIGINCLVFLAMLAGGAGLWHSPNGVQLAWGANFGPATQDGEWWRLASAMFLHFGVLHLALNMWALWDAGQLVERMYGRGRFASIYFASGIAGNLFSLVSHHGQAVSGGASGAVFGIYGALLVFLWRERRTLHPREFRWLFWGASGFAAATIALGLLVPGIDNAAHGGGLLAGALGGVILGRRLAPGDALAWQPRVLAAALLLLALLGQIGMIPAPAYRWSDELRIREEIGDLVKSEAMIGQAWKDIASNGQGGGISFGELADRIDAVVGDRYEESFEHLSRLSSDPALPSALALAAARRYAETRRDASRTLAEGLRSRNPQLISDAIVLEKRAREMQGRPPGADATPGGRPALRDNNTASRKSDK